MNLAPITESWLRLLEAPIVNRLGLALLHFVWQGIAVALVAAILLAVLRKASPQLRYVVALSCLAIMAACPLATFFCWPTPAAVSVAVADSVPANAPDTIAPTDAGSVGNESFTPLADHTNEPAPTAVSATHSPAKTPTPSTLSGTALLSQAQSVMLACSPWFFVIWCCGVAMFSLRLLAGLVGAARMRRVGTSPAAAWIGEQLESLRGRLGVRGAIAVLESTLTEVPAVVGWLRPVILIPASAVTGLAPDQLRAVLAHELAHIRRRDYLLNVLQNVVETVLFYHPAVWWLSRRIRQEREHCCDDIAVAACGDRVGYARALARLEGLRAAPANLAVASTGGRLLSRIRRIVGRQEASRNPAGACLAAVAALAIVLAVLASNWSPTIAQDDDEPPVPTVDPIVVSGTVVDDETGKPVPQFIVQGGRADDKDPTKVQWGFNENRTTSANPEAHYRASISWNGGWRARILPAGYLPQPILVKTPTKNSYDGHVIRLKRGPGVIGVVRDHEGKPVPGAAVFLVVGRIATISEGKAHSHDDSEDNIVARAETDKDGLFRQPGGWCSEASLAVSCKQVELFAVSQEALMQHKIADLSGPKSPLPLTEEEKKKLAAGTLIGAPITLPQPGRLKIRYEIPGADDIAGLYLQMKTYEMPGWKHVASRRRLSVKNADELLVEGLPPGDYELTRIKEGSFVDRRTVTIKSGETVSSDFLRTGVPVKGLVLAPRGGKLEEFTRIDLRVLPEKATGQYTEIPELMTTIDKRKIGVDGKFQTDVLPPGTYTFSVHAYLPLSKEQAAFLGLQSPSYVATAKVKVPDKGAPEEVRLPLRYVNTVDPPTDTAWGDMKDEIRLGLYMGDRKDRKVTVREEVPLVLVAQNTTGSVLTFSYASSPFHKQFPITLFNEKGERVGPKNDPRPDDYLATTVRIEPGQAIILSQQNFRVPAEAGVGKHRLQQEAALKIGVAEPSQLHKVEAELLEQKTGTLEVEVVAKKAEPPKEAFRGLKVQGQILDAKTKEPIPAATLIVGSTSRDGKQTTWQPHLRSKLADGKLAFENKVAWDATKLRVEAPGYRPAVTRVLTQGEEVTLDMHLVPDEGIRGTVVFQGQPANGAQVAISTWTYEISRKQGKLEHIGHAVTLGRKVVETDDFGRFVLPPECDSGVIAVAHKVGYGEVEYTPPEGNEPTKELVVELSAWSKVEGTLKNGDKPVAGAKFWLGGSFSQAANRVHIHASENVETDKDGRFVIEQVAPGRGYAQRYVENKDGKGGHALSGLVVRFELEPGKTASLVLGPPGQTVTGQLRLPEGFPYKVDWKKATVSVLLRAPPFRGGGDGEFWKSWSEFKTSEEGKAYFRDGVKLDPNGAFRVENLPPADYQFVANLPREAILGDNVPAVARGSGGGNFQVSPIAKDREEPLELEPTKFTVQGVAPAPPKDGAAAKEPAKSDEPPAFLWGKERDGWQLGVAWKDGKLHYAKDEPVEFELKVRNTTDKRIEIPFPGISNWDLWYSGSMDLHVRIFGDRQEKTISLGPREEQKIEVSKPQIDPRGLLRNFYTVRFSTPLGKDDQQLAKSNFGFYYDAPPAFLADTGVPRRDPPVHPGAKYKGVAWSEPLLDTSVGIEWKGDSRNLASAEWEFFLWNTSSQPIEIEYIDHHDLDWIMKFRDEKGKKISGPSFLTGPKTSAKRKIPAGQVISLGTTTWKTLAGSGTGEGASTLTPGAYWVSTFFNFRRLDYPQLHLHHDTGEIAFEVK